MAVDATATYASFRFGLGPRPGELEAVGADPRGWLAAQLAAPLALPAPLKVVAPSAQRVMLQRAGKKDPAKKKAFDESYRSDANAHLAAAIVSELPFVERLNRFWLNHFTVSATRAPVRGLVVPFEVEAIRPNLLGSFADLLIASTRHQAMLLYLDNAYSFGPNSKVGKRQNKGVNENLGREILELHTLGVGGGYDQDDVRALALILTGWTIGGEKDEAPGAFRFYAQAHEPGDKVLLGRRFPEAGQDEGLAALKMLSTHPSTARHVATKLVRHFVADDPPPAAVDKLTAVFLDQGGALPPLYQALIELDAAWQTPLAKVKTPQELLIAARRGAGQPDEGSSDFNILRQLGHIPFLAPSPAGWPDTAADWIGPESMLNRVEWSYGYAGGLDDLVLPNTLLATALGSYGDGDLAQTVAQAPSRREAIAFVLASSPFQRR